MTNSPVDVSQLPTSPAPVPHSQGYALFQAVIAALQHHGWRRHRVDTYIRDEQPLRTSMTVRHHFDHGVWELYYEMDRYWWPRGNPLRTTKIRLDRPLPEIAEVLSDLFGEHLVEATS